MHRALWLGPLALVPWGPAAAEPARTITKSDIRSNTPNVTDRRLRDVVWSLFEKRDLRGSKPPTRPLSRLFLQTMVQATHVPGLCRYDRLRVEFEPVDGKDEGPDAPARPVGLTSTSNFAFLSPPTAGYEDIVRDRLVSVAECSKLSEDQAFFTAENEEEATEGFRAWVAVIEAARAGRQLALECDRSGSGKPSCEAAIASLEPEQLEDVESCDSEFGTECRKLRAYDQVVTVVTRGVGDPAPGGIVRAKLETLILLVHEIPD